MCVATLFIEIHGAVTNGSYKSIPV
jgi:hypothetical protein